MKKYEENETDEVVGYVQGIAGIDTYDIDGDGKEEIFAMFDDEGWCGTLGCHFVLFKDFGNGYAPYDDLSPIIPSGFSAPSVIILPTKINKTHNYIAFHDRRGNWNVWLWNGKEYKHYKHIVFFCDFPEMNEAIEENRLTSEEIDDLNNRCTTKNSILVELGGTIPEPWEKIKNKK
ncbi:hypothetical protein MIDIC_70085 [Alphaproteobacteria bacterium]